jgi:hypothetical protein
MSDQLTGYQANHIYPDGSRRYPKNDASRFVVVEAAGPLAGCVAGNYSSEHIANKWAARFELEARGLTTYKVVIRRTE